MSTPSGMPSNPGRFLLALLLFLLAFVPVPHSLTPAEWSSRTNLQPYVDPAYESPTGKIAYVKATYFDVQMYRKLVNEHFPQPNPDGTLPPEFFQPPPPGQAYSVDSFKASTRPVEDLSLYFTFNGGEVQGCYPAQPTDDQGRTNCHVVNFKDSLGNYKSFDLERSCGLLKIEFRGLSNKDAEYPPAWVTYQLCPKNADALSSLGVSIYAAILEPYNLLICMPFIAIVSLLMASMYYSGRNPLSLFDITTPRLPRVKTFRVKQGTAPQMIRSVTRKYNQMSLKAQKDSLRAVTMAVRLRGGSTEMLRQAKRDVRNIFRELKRDLRLAVGTASANPDLLIGRLNDIMKRYEPAQGTRAHQAWQRYTTTNSAFLELYRKSYDAAKIMSAGRTGTRNRLTPQVSRVLDSLTGLSVRFEDSAVGRFINRIPVIRSIVNTPTKGFDAIAQIRGSRLGILSTRRRIMGGVAMALLGGADSGRFRAARRIFEATPAAPLAKWFYKWDFREFDNQHGQLRRLRDIFHPLEFERITALVTHDNMYRALLNSLHEAAPTREKAERSTKELVRQLEFLRAGLDPADPNYAANHARLTRLINAGNTLIENGINRESRIRNATSASAMERLYSNLYRSALNEDPNISADSRINLKHWREAESFLIRIPWNSYPSQSRALELLYNRLGRWGVHQDQIPITREDITAFRAYEMNTVRQRLLAYFDPTHGRYLPIDWDALQEARSNVIRQGGRMIQQVAGRWEANDAQVNQRMERMFGTVVNGTPIGRMTQDQFNRALQGSYSWISNRLSAGMSPTDGLTALSARINARLAGLDLSGTRSDSLAYLRQNMVGANPTGEFLRRRMMQLGIDAVDLEGRPLTIRELNDFEAAFIRGPPRHGAGHGHGPSARDINVPNISNNALRALGVRTQQEAVVKLLEEALIFTNRYNVQMQRTNNIFLSGSDDTRRRTINDVTSRWVAQDIVDKRSTMNAMQEIAAQRATLSYTENERRIEHLLWSTRAQERLSDMVMWGSRGGAPQAASGMGLLSQTHAFNRETFNIYKQYYANLIDPTSRYYDAEFAGRAGNRPFNAETYMLLLERGFRFMDFKKGIGYMNSTDRRGVIPLLEYDREVLRAQGYENGIVRRDVLPDIAPLLSRMTDSVYATLPIGIMVLTKFEKGGREQWLFGDPIKSGSIRSQYERAEQDIHLRDFVSRKLAGYDYNAQTNSWEYTRNNQSTRVIGDRDLAMLRRGGTFPEIFGNLSQASRAREVMRSYIQGAGYAITGALSSGLEQSFNERERWYAAQFQMRQALDRYASFVTENSTEGTSRLVGDRRDAAGKVAEYSVHGTNDDAVIDDRRRRMIEIMGSRTWAQVKRSLFASTADEIAASERNLYMAKAELKALRQQYESHSLGITHNDYLRQRGAIQAEISQQRREVRETKADFGEYAKIAAEWAGSHGSDYGSKRNWLTASWLPSLIGDFKFQQGVKQDFYWITESSVMRDPRTAIGAGPGLEYSFYTGYQTGQTTYERSRFYMTNSGWERSMRWHLGVSLWMHKGFNDLVAQSMRESSYYPSFLENDPIYPGHHGVRKNILPMLLGPFRAHYSSDYFRSAGQALADFSGISTFAAAYQSAHPVDSTSGIFRRTLDHLFMPSDHNTTPGRFVASQRMLDQFERLKSIIDTNNDAQAIMHDVDRAAPFSEDYTRQTRRMLKYLNIMDPRPRGVQIAMAGSDMNDDGSRNRFLNLYVAWHNNVWRPISPGMHDIEPMSGATVGFPQVENPIDRLSRDTKTGAFKSFSVGHMKREWDDIRHQTEYVLQYADTFHTHMDAYRDAYKKTNFALLHAMREQTEMMQYSLMNTPTVMFLNPVWGGLFYYGYRNIVKNQAWGSTVSERVEGDYGSPQPFTGGPFGRWYGGIARRLQENAQVVRDGFTLNPVPWATTPWQQRDVNMQQALRIRKLLEV